jgi:hypothetical protein
VCTLAQYGRSRKSIIEAVTMNNSSSVFPLDGNCQADPCKRGDVIIRDENDLMKIGDRNYHRGCEPPAEEGPLGTEPTSN